MSYAIIGFGAIGQAIARAFARKNLEVAVASRREPESLAPVAREIGPTIKPTTLASALEAQVIILAVPFREYREVARRLPSWNGKTIIDATNAYGISVDELGGRPSLSVIASAFEGANVVKGFNHLPARALAGDPNVKGGRRVVFLSGSDEGAAKPVAALAEQLGFAPIWLGAPDEGGALIHGSGRTWGQLIFQDLVKF